MVVALFVLSLAMIVGGLIAVVLGWDIILLERGWAMVIAGSVSAGSGAVLLGLTVAISRLAGLRSDLADLRDTLRLGAMPAPPALDPVAAVSSGLLAGGAMGTAPAAPGEAGDQPDLPLFMRSGATSTDERPSDAVSEAPRITLPPDLFGTRRDPDAGRSDEAEADRLADRPDDNDRFGLRPPELGTRDVLLSLDRPSPPEVSVEVDREFDQGLDRDSGEDRGRAEERGLVDNDEPRLVPLWEPGERDDPTGRETLLDGDPDDDLPAAPSRTADRPAAEMAAEPSRSEAEDREGERAEDEPVERPAGPLATVIGTYNSGENRYVMFSDGSIEAETPEGLFRFASLDELKEFIASGGERRGS